ncbi:CPCC family cysteine-rich protein [Hymenobacter sublimis]|uniref:CPCC family cysteine-rich protein n=1 Tax=Hymenobacter sublimis TaxID=2933777 RepID=UPI0035CBEDA3
MAYLQTSFQKGREVQLDSTCPACGYPTLGERNSWEICTICRWEDDGQDEEEADEVWGGPNGGYSLTEWRLEVATMLAALQTDSVDLQPEQKAIEAILRIIQVTIDTCQHTDIVALQKQIETLTLLFDKLNDGRISH